MYLTRLKLSKASNKTNNEAHNSTSFDLQDFNVYTFKGYISLSELNEDAFKPLGYEIIKPTLPVPTLRMLNEPTCEQVFTDWLKILSERQPETPPVHLPIIHADDYLINGYSALSWAYMNNHTRKEMKPKNWDRIGEFLSFSKQQLGALEYQKESESMYHAMNDFKIKGMTGFVVGSMQPWLEVMALQIGAQRILTVEHYSLDIQNGFEDKLSSVHPEDVAKNWQLYSNQFDFAATFSVLQHVGLGRYGDPLDAKGDLREMHKIRCMLKKGGLLFLGVPYGTDSIQYNIQRIYGSLRMAMMFYGFEWIASYSGDSEKPFELHSKRLNKQSLFLYTHYTLVLKKL
ncbi:hypothetical protein CRE_09462 [Caenorhabditis remanei]|uniref:Uncharacterized protein n=1 Tax=Caenorhabditis remanei TaxID=31234 RepID=E3LIZ2_CAERE|nr:hypothetical protein CRE_09462 [Caenorhabditis remanei]